MAFNLFGPLTTSAIDAKLLELDQKKSQKATARTELGNHLKNLDTELKRANLEFQLEETPSAGRIVNEVKGRVAKLQAQYDQIGEDIRAIEEAVSELKRRREPAQTREVLQSFEEQNKRLFSLAKEMEPLIAGLKKKIGEGSAIADQLQSFVFPLTNKPMITPVNCGATWREVVLRTLDFHLRDQLPYLAALGFDSRKYLADLDGSLSKLLAAQMDGAAKRLRLALTGEPNPTTNNSEDSDEDAPSA